MCECAFVFVLWVFKSKKMLARHRIGNFLINNDICVDLCTVIDLMGVIVYGDH